MCESCVAPCLILIISMFYKKDEQVRKTLHADYDGFWLNANKGYTYIMVLRHGSVVHYKTYVAPDFEDLEWPYPSIWWIRSICECFPRTNWRKMVAYVLPGHFVLQRQGHTALQDRLYSAWGSCNRGWHSCFDLAAGFPRQCPHVNETRADCCTWTCPKRSRWYGE